MCGLGQHYQPSGISISTFSTYFTLLLLFFASAAFEVCWQHSCLFCWAVTCNKELLCLKHQSAKPRTSASPWVDPASNPLYKDSVHTYVTHKNEWGAELLKNCKPILAKPRLLSKLTAGSEKGVHYNNPII